LTVSFDAPFHIDVPRGAPRAEKERLASQQVMVAIGRLLPKELWGVYAAAIQEVPGRGEAQEPASRRRMGEDSYTAPFKVRYKS
jgi:hypothetical protein